MTFADKVKRLIVECGGTNRLPWACRLTPDELADYINPGWKPTVAEAEREAVRFDVDYHWLMDDSQGWPPRRARW